VSTIGPTPAAIERFLPKVHKGDGCWEWIAGKNIGGYGQFWNGERIVMAHRFAYEAWVGPIPEGLVIDHLCRNRSCVNPRHMEPVEHRTNTLRGIGPTAINARIDACPHGHPYTPANTIILSDKKRRCRMCKRARDLIRYHASDKALRREKRRRKV
jgi:hypothetical protein